MRKWANLILTNPDMLHVGVLPHHDRWGDVLSNLRYVVVDEARLPGESSARTLPTSFAVSAAWRASTAPIPSSSSLRRRSRTRGARPAAARRRRGGDRCRRRAEGRARDRALGPAAHRRGARAARERLGEASRLMAAIVERGVRTLCFAKSRKAAELVHRFTAQRLGDSTRLSPYRAGYTPAQRREIERRLVEGELLGVSATNALELGIDVGLLDCVICVGFPGTVASLRQQWGRAGRTKRPCRPGRLGRPRPVRHARARSAARTPRRGRDSRLRQPRVLWRRSVRAAAFERRSTRPTRRHLGPPRSSGRRSSRPATYPERLRLGRDATTRRGRRLRPTVGQSSRSASSTPRPDRCSAWSSASVPTRRCMAAPCTSTSASPSASSTSTSGRAALVEPFANPRRVRRRKDTMTAIWRPHEVSAASASGLLLRLITVTEQVVAYRASGSRTARRSRPSPRPPLRPSSRRKPSGSCPSPGCSRASRRCRGCWARSMPPSTP